MRKYSIKCLTISIIIFFFLTAGCLFYGWCQESKYKKNVSDLTEKVSILKNLIKEAESKRIDVSNQKVTLTTAKLFIDFTI